MKKILFIDRDGVLLFESPNDPQIDSLEKMEFIPGLFTWLGRIVQETDYELVMVTNQDGLGSTHFPEETFWPVHNKLLKSLAGEGIHFSAVHIDHSFPHENKPTRKPNIEMLRKYLTEEYDIPHSIVIGDRITDLQLAKNLGAKGILFRHPDLPPLTIPTELSDVCLQSTHSWKKVYETVIPKRTSTIRRQTNETDVTINIDLNGSGKSLIHTGLSFFDHMLEQLAKHGQLDLSIHTRGDLHVDEHHTIEDTALALGEAFTHALGNKKGIGRYGFSLPMDDCLAQVAIDFGGRPWLVWKADFKREKIGDMPTEMFYHFFNSFATTCKCNLNIQAEGENEHHKIESIFKAFAKAIHMGIRKDTNNPQLPTTKGVL